MQRANIMLSLAGDVGNTIPKFGVTPGEIVLLQAIHGPEAVHDVEPVEENDEMSDEERKQFRTSARDDLARLKAEYASATDGSLNRIVDKVFPGVGARVPENLDEIGLSESHMKATARASLPKGKTTAKPGRVSGGSDTGVLG